MLAKFIVFSGLFLGLQNNFAMEKECEEEKQQIVDEKGEELLNAIKKRDIQTVTKLINQKDTNLNYRGKYGCTPLMYSILYSNEIMTISLIDAGADVNLVSESGYSPLFYAITHQQLKVIQNLIDAHADVNLTTDQGQTPLKDAIRSGNLNIIKLLLDSGAKINLADSRGKTPLEYAVLKGKADVVKFLLDSDANVNVTNEKGKSPLQYAIKNGNPGVVKILLDAGANINFSIPNILNNITNSGMREKRFEIEQATGLAQKKLADEILKVIQQPIDQIKDKKVLKLFVENQKNEVKRLIDLSGLKLAQIQDKNWYNPLHFAILKGNFRLAEWLIFEEPELIQKKNNLGQTSLELGFEVWDKSKNFLGFVKFIKQSDYVTQSEVKEAIEKFEKAKEIKELGIEKKK